MPIPLSAVTYCIMLAQYFTLFNLILKLKETCKLRLGKQKQNQYKEGCRQDSMVCQV